MRYYVERQCSCSSTCTWAFPSLGWCCVHCIVNLAKQSHQKMLRLFTYWLWNKYNLHIFEWGKYYVLTHTKCLPQNTFKYYEVEYLKLACNILIIFPVKKESKRPAKWIAQHLLIGHSWFLRWGDDNLNFLDIIFFLFEVF